VSFPFFETHFKLSFELEINAFLVLHFTPTFGAALEVAKELEVNTATRTRILSARAMGYVKSL
jgi:hypothetical protein